MPIVKARSVQSRPVTMGCSRPTYDPEIMLYQHDFKYDLPKCAIYLVRCIVHVCDHAHRHDHENVSDQYDRVKPYVTNEITVFLAIIRKVCWKLRLEKVTWRLTFKIKLAFMHMRGNEGLFGGLGEYF
jgi:hypothetical protein